MTFNLEVARYWLLCSVFIALNFSVVILPLAAWGALFHGSLWCMVILIIGVLEYACPLRPGPDGFWKQFNNFFDNTKGMKSYNDLEVVVEGKFDSKRNYCLCYFPHALYGCGLFVIRRYFYDTYGMWMLFTGADVIFHVPLLRRIMTWWGLTHVSKAALKRSLKLPFPHNILMLEPDGIAGMFYGLQHEQIVLDKRRGFCKIALQTGAALVPCYFFGANELYNRYYGPDSLCAKISHNYHASFLFWTDAFNIPFGSIPKANKMVLAIGSPIIVEQVDEPSQEQIDTLHARFVADIKGLYDRHKSRLGDEWASAHDRLYLETEDPTHKKAA